MQCLFDQSGRGRRILLERASWVPIQHWGAKLLLLVAAVLVREIADDFVVCLAHTTTPETAPL